MRSLSSNSIIIATLITVSLIGCSENSGSSPIARANEEPKINNPVGEPKPTDPNATAKGTKKQPAMPVNPVKSFSFVAPSSDWIPGAPSEGDGTYTKATLKLSNPKADLNISSVGLPTKGEKATKLVEECETGFAKGIAQHPDMAREWITKGFSVSRYADPTKGEVSVWCISNTCKVRLDFAFGAGTKAADNIKVADAATDAFFEKNPTGGAVLK